MSLISDFKNNLRGYGKPRFKAGAVGFRLGTWPLPNWLVVTWLHMFVKLAKISHSSFEVVAAIKVVIGSRCNYARLAGSFLWPRPHRAGTLSDDARLTSV